MAGLALAARAGWMDGRMDGWRTYLKTKGNGAVYDWKYTGEVGARKHLEPARLTGGWHGCCETVALCSEGQINGTYSEVHISL